MFWIWRSGELEASELVPCSRGFTHGYGVFETMLARDGVLVAVGLHLRRLEEGCLRLGLPLPGEEIVGSIEGRLGPGRQRVRLQVSDGGTVTVAVTDAGPVPDGVKVRTAPWVRNERSPLAGIKCCSYADNLLAVEWAKQRGADELLFANTRGELCEAAMANVFLVRDTELWTPPLDSGCLPGTARERVIGLAREMGIGLREEAMALARVAEAGELFLTSATKGVVPVVELDGQARDEGEMTGRLKGGFAARWMGGADAIRRLGS